MKHRQLLFTMSAGALLACASMNAGAQQDHAYPSRAIRLIVPFPPGGGTDIVARSLGTRMGESLGQQFVIDNRGGAGGNIGAELAAKAAPDGYTLFMASATQAINVTLYRDLTYDLAKDFVPISLVATLPYTLVCNPGLSVTSVKALVQLTKDKPGQLNYSSAGSGTGTHLAMEMFKTAAGINIVHIPYKGSAPAVTDLLGGQVQLMFGNTATVLPQIKAGRLRALAVTSLKRSPLLPEVATVAESVVPGFEVTQWYGVLAPARTPPRLIARLHAEIAKATEKPELKDRLHAEGAEATSNTPQQYTAFIRAEIAKWAKAVRESGARVD